MPPIRRRSKQTGDHAVAATQELLNEAGCAVNELTQNDYGYDLLVQLPEYVPDESEIGWPVSPFTVLVQVKGGTYAQSGVRLSRDRWQQFASSPTPVYVAAVPAAAAPWIASVEELLPRGVEGITAKSYSAQPQDRVWAPGPFVSDALAGALLGSPRLRRWWRLLQPDLSSSGVEPEDQYDRGHALLLYLLDLEILMMISGPTMTVDDFEACAENVRTMVANEHSLIEALDKLGLASRGSTKDLELLIDLPVYVPESDFVEPSGRVTESGVAGHNNLRAVGDRVVVRLLAAPAIELFLSGFDWDADYDLYRGW